MRAQINSLSESYMAATPIAWLVAGPAAAQHHLTQFRRVRLSQDSATRPLSPPPPQRHVRVSRAPARCIEPPSVLPRGKVRWAVGFSPSADLATPTKHPVGLHAEICCEIWDRHSAASLGRLVLPNEASYFDSVTFDEADLRQNNLIW